VGGRRQGVFPEPRAQEEGRAGAVTVVGRGSAGLPPFACGIPAASSTVPVCTPRAPLTPEGPPGCCA
jgi:hypothetical protein